MAIIKKNGAPTKHTVGAIGDIYENTETGKRYSCSCIYSDSMGVEEYEWRETDQDIEEDILEEEEPEQPAEETPVEKEKPEQPVRDQQFDQNRNNNRNWNGNKTQYNKQYRPNNK